VGVPGLVPEKISRSLLHGSYIHVQKTDIVLKLGDTEPGRDVEIPFEPAPRSDSRGRVVRAGLVQQATEVRGLARMIVLDRGLARPVNTPVAWKCYKRQQLNAENPALTGACVPIQTGRPHQYMLLWGVSAAEGGDDSSDTEVDGYQTTPLADVYAILERLWRQDAAKGASQEEDALFQGGIMDRMKTCMHRNSTRAAVDIALETAHARAGAGRQLLFVWDVVTHDAPFAKLAYTHDCARPPLRDLPNFESVHGISRFLTFTKRRNRTPVEMDLFCDVY